VPTDLVITLDLVSVSVSVDLGLVGSSAPRGVPAPATAIADAINDDAMAGAPGINALASRDRVHFANARVESRPRAIRRWPSGSVVSFGRVGSEPDLQDADQDQ
jgi:hypothetical protein